jgi:tetratricopeptide (TPR) repeat protein
MVLLFLSILCLNIRPIHSNDFWHHLKAGQFVLKNGGVAHTEPFLISAKGMPWIQKDWLAQVLFYAIYSKAGANALIVLKALTFAASFVILAFACRQRTKSLTIPVLVSALAGLSLCTRSFVRPEFISYLLLSFFIFFLEKARTRSWRWLIGTAPLVAVWANVHGSFIVGIVLLGITAAGESLRRLTGRRGQKGPTPAPSRRRAILLWVFVLVSLGAACLNPYGIAIFKVPFRLFGSEELSRWIVEWRPFTLRELLRPEQIGFWILLAATLITIRKINLTDLLVLGAFFYLALKSSRNVMLFLFICAPIFACHLDHLAGILSRIRIIPKRMKRPLVGWTALALFLGLVVWYGQGIPDMRRFGLGVDESIIPRRGADFLTTHNIKGRIYNTFRFGNYLLWRLDPGCEIFIDGRVDVYGGEILRLATDIQYAREGWQETLDEYGITVAFIDTKVGGAHATGWERLGKALFASNDWALVYFDEICLIFLKRTTTNNETIGRLGEFSFYPVDLVSYEPAVITEAQFHEAFRQLRRIASADEENLLAQRALGVCYLFREDYDRAIEHFSIVRGYERRSPLDAYYLGLAFMRKGDLQQAADFLKLALWLGAPADKVYGELGILYLNAESPEKAIRVLQKALEDSPGDWQLHWHLALAYEGAGDIPSAVDEMRIVVKLNPEFEAARERLEELLYPEGKPGAKGEPPMP